MHITAFLCTNNVTTGKFVISRYFELKDQCQNQLTTLRDNKNGHCTRRFEIETLEVIPPGRQCALLTCWSGETAWQLGLIDCPSISAEQKILHLFFKLQKLQYFVLDHGDLILQVFQFSVV